MRSALTKVFLVLPLKKDGRQRVGEYVPIGSAQIIVMTVGFCQRERL